jgi:FOG: Ankyrin repeat
LIIAYVLTQVSKNTALHYAALGKSGACIKYLLKHELPINIQDAKGTTPLHIAIIEQDFDIAKVLLENGAQVLLKNEMGLTPYDIAESLRARNLQNLLRRYK